MYSYTEENYLKAIYKLSESQTEGISTNAIAESMNTKAASVTDMLKKLADKDLISYIKYQGVSLTSLGKKIAIETVRKHRLWEVFLFEKLHFGWDQVHEAAEQLEHIQSELLIDKLEEFLGYPSHDPHGDPIPSKDGKFKKSNLMILSELNDSEKGVMSGVKDHSPVFLKHLDKIGLNLGKEIQLKEKNEYDGSVSLLISGKIHLQISREVAKNILIAKK